MITLNIKQTKNINLNGKPAPKLKALDAPKTVGVVPYSIPFIKPKLQVKEGDKVKVGSLLFIDKRNPELRFLSPAAGVVSQVVYGPKRRLDRVIIEVAAKEAKESFDKIEEKDVDGLTKETLVAALVKGGLWQSFREFPFKRIPKSTVTPPAIYVSLDPDEPFLPQSEVLLKDRKTDFEMGIALLKKLTSNVHIGVSDKNINVKREFSSSITHQLSGDYPANDAGVFLYYNKTDEADNRSWTIGLQDLLQIVTLLKTGEYPTQKIVSLGGSEIREPMHYQVRVGSPIQPILQSQLLSQEIRIVAGGVLTGRQSSQDDYLGYDEAAVNVIAEGTETEMFYFFKPGFNRPTQSKTYLSALFSNMKFNMTSYINGGHRSCIACGDCPKVCPVDLLPQFIHKSLRAGDIEEAIDHGLLDCVECGMCTYVCPSKIELMDDIVQAKAQLEKEVS